MTKTNNNNSMLIILAIGAIFIAPSIFGKSGNTSAASPEILAINSSVPAECQPIWQEIQKYDWDKKTALAVVRGESSCRNDALANEPDGSTSTGPWQINSIHNTPDSSDQDPFLSTQYAYGLYKARIARGQAGFSPWGAFINESYKKFMN
jgi:hypothetical protein